MQNISIHKAGQLPENVKSAVEHLLGRPVDADEEVSVMAFRPHNAPPRAARRKIAHSLKAHMDKMAARVKGVPEEEIDEILDEAMRSVRPSYRRRK